MYVAGHLSPEEFWRMYDDIEQRLRAEAGQLPLFGLTHWTGERLIGEWSHHNKQLSSASLQFGDDPTDGSAPGLRVYTSVPSSFDKVVLLKLGLLGPLHDGDRHHRTLVALSEEPTTPLCLAVEGVDREFRFSRWADRWWAATKIDDLEVVVESRGIEPEEVALERVSDVEPFIVGRRNQLKQLRGEL